MDRRVDDQRDGRGRAGPSALDGTVVVGGGLVLLLAAAIGVIRFFGGSPMERGVEGALGACALAAVIAAPGVLALLARFDRPALLIPAGVLLMPLSVISMAGVTLPLLIPAVMLLVAYHRRSAGASRPLLPVAISSGIVMWLVFAALVSLFVHEDPRSYSTPTEGGSTSDVITIGESLLALSLVGSALILGWRWAAPPVDRPR